ncbi:MAG: S-layer family protein [Leptolyngbya sp. SIO1D8]|nr:S-layer family protein [Leptolyngbya sp. SIO1D8]
MQSSSDLSITLTEGSFIQATTSSRAFGGNLTFETPGKLTIQGAGALTVESFVTPTGGVGAGDLGPAGNLTVQANSVALKDSTRFSAESASLQGGGNIAFNVGDDIILSGGSFINAESINPIGGDGGNVFINTDFLIALPNQNNDIIANAVGGNGGRVEINAFNIFGFTQQSGFTTEELRSNQTNDLSASSQFGVEGDIVLNVLDVDPARGLTELPADLADLANQIVAGCGLGNTDDQSQFVMTGRGGLPPGPSDLNTVNNVRVPWITYGDRDTPTTAIAPPIAQESLIEAQDMMIDANGNTYLVTPFVEPTARLTRLSNTGECAATFQD